MSTIEEYRTQIHEKDAQLLSIIKDRLAIGDKVAQVKTSRGLPTIDTEAEQATMDNLTQTAMKFGIDGSFAKRLGELLIEESIRIQDENRPPQSKDQILKEIFERAQEMMRKGVKVTRFEIGEPNFPTPPVIIRGLTDTVREKKVIGYGPAAGLPELRKALAEELSAEHEREIDPDQILITPGGRFGIFASICTFVSPLQRVLVPQPAWPAYEECVNFVRGRVIPLKSKLEDRWELDVAGLENEMKKGIRMLIVNSPSNPTGKAIDRRKFEEIVDLARKYGVMVLSDEVYGTYNNDHDTPSILDFEYENSVYLNSFSKQFGLTGWRIAFLVTTRDNALRIRRLIQTAITCVPEFIQTAALVALRKGRAQAQKKVKQIMRKVNLTCRELRKINVSFYEPDGAFYVFPRANKSNFDSAKFANDLLNNQHVSVSPGQSFGDYPAFFRLAVSLPESQIPGAIKAIGKAIDSWP